MIEATRSCCVFCSSCRREYPVLIRAAGFQLHSRKGITEKSSAVQNQLDILLLRIKGIMENSYEEGFTW